jgi:ElaB/YqjD/DUF883 family membrane-anchored ribosome-binding protein
LSSSHRSGIIEAGKARFVRQVVVVAPSDEEFPSVEEAVRMNPVKDAGALLRDRTVEARDSVEQAMRTSRERLENKVQEHPLRTLGIAVGAGILVGLLLGLGKRRGPN